MSDKKQLPNDSSALSIAQVPEVVPVIESVVDLEGNSIPNNGSTSSRGITLKGKGTANMLMHLFWGLADAGGGEPEFSSGAFKVGEDGNWSITSSFGAPMLGSYLYKMKSSYRNQLESEIWRINYVSTSPEKAS
ncbi:hypothetical protein D3C77_377570 [compost metagenome]